MSSGGCRLFVLSRRSWRGFRREVRLCSLYNQERASIRVWLAFSAYFHLRVRSGGVAEQIYPAFTEDSGILQYFSQRSREPSRAIKSNVGYCKITGPKPVQSMKSFLLFILFDPRICTFWRHGSFYSLTLTKLSSAFHLQFVWPNFERGLRYVEQ